MAELTLEDLLSDPLVRQLMARDGLVQDEVRALMADARSRLGRLQRPAAGLGQPGP